MEKIQNEVNQTANINGEKKKYNKNDFRIEHMKKENYGLYVKFFNDHFLTREPLGLGLHLCEEDRKELFTENIEKWMESEASVCAIYVPTNQLAGLMLTNILSRNNTQNSQDEMLPKNPRVQTLLKILSYLKSSCNLFEDEEMEKILDICVTAVHPEFAGNGLVYRLTERSEEIAKELGCQMATTQSTNKITQHIRRKMGYEACFTVNYEDLEIDGVKPLDVSVMNGTICACVFKKYLK